MYVFYFCIQYYIGYIERRVNVHISQFVGISVAYDKTRFWILHFFSCISDMIGRIISIGLSKYLLRHVYRDPRIATMYT